MVIQRWWRTCWKGIEVRLNEDYLAKKQEYDQLAEKVVYTGAIDAF